MMSSNLMQPFEYNAWATGRVLDAAVGLSAEQFMATPIPAVGSLRDTLTHTLSAERLWRTRLTTGDLWPTIQPEEIPTVDRLRERWSDEERAMRAYLGTLDEAALDEPIRFRRQSGELSNPGGAGTSSCRWSRTARSIAARLPRS